MTNNPTPFTTPEAARAEQKRVLGLLKGATEGEWYWPRTKDAALMAQSKPLATAYAEACGQVAELMEAQRWIPVEERLPEVGASILVWDKDGKNCREATYEYWDEDDYRFCGRSYADVLEVTHWQPLPPPPAPASAEGGAS